MPKPVPGSAPATYPEPSPVRPTKDDVVLHARHLEQVLGYLRDGTNVNVVGMRSSGRSALVRRVIERLNAGGASVTRICGVRALQDRPLSALAVAGVQIAATPGQLPALSSAVGSLEVLLSARPSVLVIDDADDLDPTTVGAIVAVHSRARTPVLTTSRPGGRRQPGTSALTAELQPGARVTLAPLRFEGVHTLVHDLLGGAVDPATVARVAAKSGGLPGLVAAVVDTGRRENRIVQRDGLWVTRDSLWTTAMSQSVEPFLTDIDDAGLDAVTLLSFAGTLPLRTAQRMVAPDTLASLDDAGLLQVLADGDEPVVGVFPPLVAEFITHEGATMRNLLARDRLAEVDRHVVPVVHVDRGQEAAGGPLEARLLAQHWTAERVARRGAWERSATPAAAVALLESVVLTTGAHHEVEAVLQGTSAEGTALDRARLVAWTATHHALSSGTAAGALDGLDQHRGTLPGCESLLDAAALDVSLLVGDVPAAALDAAAPPAEDEPVARAALLVSRAAAALAAGRPARADELLDAVPDVDGRREHVASLRALSRLLACDVRGAVDDALAGVERARRDLAPEALHEHAYVAGYGMQLQGRVVELDELTSSVLALGTAPRHLPHVQAALLTFAANAAEWQGRRDYARTTALQASALRGPRGPHPWMSADLLTALVHDPDDDAAADAIWQVALERAQAGFLAAAVTAGVRAVERSPSAERAAQVSAMAATCDAPLLSRLADYAVAIASADEKQLAVQESALYRAGLRQFAVRTAVARSVLLLEAGEARAALEHADSAWSQAGLRGRDLCGLFAPLDRAVNLTVREREVAVLVARGYSLPEIAARMVLSVRTVENHVFSASHKVGADGREGLARAARTWLTCGQR
ncbi:helix-turn-helix transcriptional regulator [Oerskovia rustica]|uniref:HTH luxR-type domain-containing protein n=1 Tax=Oerskovia rustica TaxID=2762237 RepID=A0ABR8RX22_9CELL|nr:LuxR family transcriptional regulator [Oerskovia rustica]MBD7952343.1 hypothetical protein [Oerskovia rustica]